MTVEASASPSPARDARGRGVAATLGAFVMWGFAPIYFKSVGRAGALEILSHRVVWSVVLLLVAVALTRRRGEIRLALGGPRRWALLLVTSVLISGNWLLFIWAVNAGHIVDSSLGYFINPLVNVALGALFLGERFTKSQGVAIGLACAGVASFVWSFGKLPWLSLVLPLQFGIYGLLRKKADIDPLVGLLAETALLAPAAVAYLAWLGSRGEAAFLNHGPGFFALLAFAGVMTALPLLLFGYGAQRLRLSTVGLIQYVSPTCQLAAGVMLYGEAFTKAHAVAFALIWLGLLLYSGDAILRAPAPSVAATRN
ncbi:MAG TPA: EamA family transporter RarD [Myxococcales bacterium]|jgi:chloramphenicol-sensitive protein RarD